MAAFSAIASRPIAAPVPDSSGAVTVLEAATATESVNGASTFPVSLTESGSAADALVEFEIITEAASATDTPSCALIRAGVMSEAAGARESVLNATAVYPVFILTAAAASATDTVSLPVWTDNSDDTQTWTTNTPSGSVWTSNSHAESTWTEN